MSERSCFSLRSSSLFICSLFSFFYLAHSSVVLVTLSPMISSVVAGAAAGHSCISSRCWFVHSSFTNADFPTCSLCLCAQPSLFDRLLLPSTSVVVAVIFSSLLSGSLFSPFPVWRLRQYEFNDCLPTTKTHCDHEFIHLLFFSSLLPSMHHCLSFPFASVFSYVLSSLLLSFRPHADFSLLLRFFFSFWSS